MRFISLAGLAVLLSACGSAPPADESPVAPAIVCEQIGQTDNDSSSECIVPEDEVADENIGDAYDDTSNKE